MSNSVAFHDQIASIMEVLANTAVTEICKLVDDGYAVLRLELSQSQKENEVLKKKLLQFRDAQQCAVGTKAREHFVNGDSGGVQTFEKPGGLKECRLQNEEEELGSQMNVSLVEDATPSHKESSPAQYDNVSTEESADTGDVNQNSLLIKAEEEEELEEELKNCDHQRDASINGKRVVELSASGGGRSPIQDTQNKPAKHTEELTEQHRTIHSVWEVSGFENILKEEPGNDSENQGVQHGRSENKTARLNSQDSEHEIFERLSKWRTSCAQTKRETGAYYPKEMDSDILSFVSELQLVPASLGGAGISVPSFASRGTRPGVVEIDSVPVKMESMAESEWNMEAFSGMVHMKHQYHGDEMEVHEIHTENAINFFTPHAHVTMKESTELSQSDGPNMNGCVPYQNNTVSRNLRSMHRVRARKEKYICTYCGKCCTRASYLKVHQRVHTGEKPFRCQQCGKGFSQACSLKKHVLVHTGEKPFTCLECGKRFSQSSSLKNHQIVHTGEKPFSCSQCGKQFSDPSNLRKHKSIHTGEKPFKCTECGKTFNHPSNLRTHLKIHTEEKP